MGAWVQTHYDDFRCNPEDPPLWKYYVAVGTDKNELTLRHDANWDAMLKDLPAPSVHFANDVLYKTPGTDADKLLRAAHVRMLFLGVALGAGIAWWAWRLAGALAAVVAAGAFCLDPNFLAHSILVKNDVPITLVFLLLMSAIWLLGERATIFRCAAMLLLVGAALTTKFSGVLAFPMLAIALLLRVIIARPWPVLRWTLSTRLSRAGAAAAIFLAAIIFGYIFIWACYGFRFGPNTNPSDSFDLTSRSAVAMLDAAENEMLLKQDPVPAVYTLSQTRQWVSQWHPSITVRFVKSWNRLHLLPQSWLYGFLYTYATSLARRSFLCGQIRVDGWWYYFPLAMIFKTPLATLVGLALAALVWLRRIGRSPAGRDWWAISAILVAPGFYMFMAMRTNLNIGLRHVFPVYPFLFIFLGVMAAQSVRAWPRFGRVIIVLLFAGLLTETFSAYPNFIPFFNVAVGGSRGGFGLLSDSNIDWGQDLPEVAKWQSENSDRQLYLSQFSLPDPKYYGIRYIEMPGVLFDQKDQTVPSGMPEVYAISAVTLQGTFVPPDLEEKVYSHFVKEQPFGVIGGGSMYLFNQPSR
jgi:hypothetical protein